jgi:hypothetical protein
MKQESRRFERWECQISAFGFERQNLVNLCVIEDSQGLFLFWKFGQSEGLSIREGLRTMAIIFEPSQEGI